MLTGKAAEMIPGEVHKQTPMRLYEPFVDDFKITPEIEANIVAKSPFLVRTDLNYRSHEANWHAMEGESIPLHRKRLIT